MDYYGTETLFNSTSLRPIGYISRGNGELVTTLLVLPVLILLLKTFLQSFLKKNPKNPLKSKVSISKNAKWHALPSYSLFRGLLLGLNMKSKPKVKFIVY